MLLTVTLSLFLIPFCGKSPWPGIPGIRPGFALTSPFLGLSQRNGGYCAHRPSLEALICSLVLPAGVSGFSLCLPSLGIVSSCPPWGTAQGPVGGSLGAGGRHKAVRVLLKGLKLEAMGLGRCPSVSSARRLFKCWNEVRLTLRLKIQVCKRCCLYIKLNLTLSLQGVRHKYFSVGGSPSVGVYRCPGYCGFPLDAHYPIPVVPLHLLLPRLGSPVRSPASPEASPSILSEAIATEQYGTSRTHPSPLPLWNSPSPHSFVGPALLNSLIS